MLLQRFILLVTLTLRCSGRDREVIKKGLPSTSLSTFCLFQSLERFHLDISSYVLHNTFSQRNHTVTSCHALAVSPILAFYFDQK